MWYWLLKFAVVAPALVLGYAPRWRGREHLPRSGPFVLAANHTSVIETAIVPFAVNRRVTFVAKSKYYRGQGAKGRLLGWFLRAIGQVPIDPASASSAQPALDAAREILLGGGVWGSSRRERVRPTAGCTAAAPAGCGWPCPSACPSSRSRSSVRAAVVRGGPGAAMAAGGSTSPTCRRSTCRPGPDARTTRRRGARRPRRSWPRSAR
ncbi:MAG: 1-acyl-sn-glycerol-3-phosphate acyltransferase [Actinomycetales bacterium]|uniref:1-acyl-sn-glycerol-3-phosphate acyltransferase n=1 Tax=Candidatus Phosphoribacter hodrii TaxID=2953743 RepID=A0A934X531_9MICO|nr:1-acyl-sn-glycerol-3-phosphate acyltransferase [Candidatus Phosphoribacter hodrii]